MQDIQKLKLLTVITFMCENGHYYAYDDFNGNRSVQVEALDTIEQLRQIRIDGFVAAITASSFWHKLRATHVHKLSDDEKYRSALNLVTYARKQRKDRMANRTWQEFLLQIPYEQLDPPNAEELAKRERYLQDLRQQGLNRLYEATWTMDATRLNQLLKYLPCQFFGTVINLPVIVMSILRINTLRFCSKALNFGPITWLLPKSF